MLLPRRQRVARPCVADFFYDINESVAFPPAHLLVGIGGAELVRSVTPLPRWRAWIVAATLAVLPDLDFVLGILRGRGSLYHGTFTHSLVAVALIAGAAGLFAGWRWALLAGVGYGSHLLVDLMDDRGQTNVLLWWPFSSENAVALGRFFPTVPFEHGDGMIGAFLSLFEPAVAERLLEQTAVGAATLAGAWVAAALIRKARERTG